MRFLSWSVVHPKTVWFPWDIFVKNMLIFICDVTKLYVLPWLWVQHGHQCLQGLLDNLKRNNSVRRAQTCVGGLCVSQGYKGLKVFLTNGNVNLPSWVHFNFLPGGRRTGAERWHGKKLVGCNERPKGCTLILRHTLDSYCLLQAVYVSAYV